MFGALQSAFWLGAFALSFSLFGDTEPAEIAYDLRDVTVTSKKSFRVPVSVKPDFAPKLTEINLAVVDYVSGECILSMAVSPRDKEFEVTVDSDGVYFFYVQVVYEDGSTFPDADDWIEATTPSLKVLVDSNGLLSRTSDSKQRAK